jgi:hypothetical protein
MRVPATLVIAAAAVVVAVVLGPRGAHKLTAEILAWAEQALAADPALRPAALAGPIEANFGVRAHPRSIERALVADPADLAAQHLVLVPQYQESGILGCLTPGQHHQATEQATHNQLDSREDHSGMIPARQGRPSQIR